MAEPTVQVPVSLIDEADVVMREGTRHERYLMAARLHALLSQPTPTAEEVRIECPRCKGYGVDPSVQQAGDKVIDCTRCGGDGEVAESPRIGDMAPGTTFMAATVQGYSSRWTVAVIGVLDATGMRYSIGYINPSTIHDVTPPTESTK